MRVYRSDFEFPAAKVQGMTRENIHLETHPAVGGRIQVRPLRFCVNLRFCVTLRFRDPAIREAIKA